MAAALLLASPLLAVAAPAAPTAAPIPVKWWDIDAAVQAQQLDYEEQALAFALQGLANKRSAGRPTLMFKAGFLDFDWPDADGWWRGELEAAGRVSYTNLTSTLCGLVEGAASPGLVTGAVLYENANSSGTGYTLAPALTLASQQSLLPVTEALLAKHSCLSKFKVAEDLRIASNPHMASRDTAWRWAIDTLLPKASKTTVFNLYHFDPAADSDPQSHATLANVDYAIMSKAFVMDLRPNDAGDNALMAEVFAKLDPLFDAFVSKATSCRPRCRLTQTVAANRAGRTTNTPGRRPSASAGARSSAASRLRTSASGRCFRCRPRRGARRGGCPLATSSASSTAASTT